MCLLKSIIAMILYAGHAAKRVGAYFIILCARLLIMLLLMQVYTQLAMIHQTMLQEDPDSPIVPESPAPLFEAASPNAIPAMPPPSQQIWTPFNHKLDDSFQQPR